MLKVAVQSDYKMYIGGINVGIDTMLKELFEEKNEIYYNNNNTRNNLDFIIDYKNRFEGVKVNSIFSYDTIDIRHGNIIPFNGVIYQDWDNQARHITPERKKTIVLADSYNSIDKVNGEYHGLAILSNKQKETVDWFIKYLDYYTNEDSVITNDKWVNSRFNNGTGNTQRF